ncbi:MAG TPA: hypothetical protein VNW90_23085 [Acetobacteraceae bacterium]|jgi:hypothetical protein|nr:hypothetical protein [Acetobacteraceae bacterium]
MTRKPAAPKMERISPPDDAAFMRFVDTHKAGPGGPKPRHMAGTTDWPTADGEVFAMKQTVPGRGTRYFVSSNFLQSWLRSV